MLKAIKGGKGPLKPDKNTARFKVNAMFIGKDGRYSLRNSKHYDVLFVLLLDSGRVQVHLPDMDSLSYIEYESWLDSRTEWEQLSLIE